MTIDKKSLAYVAISAIFFSVFGMFLVVAVAGIFGSFEIPWFGYNYPGALQAVFGLISLCGCILCLKLAQNQSRLWYLGIPLALSLAAITITSFMSPLSLLTDRIFMDQNAGQAALFLLAPASVLVFYSEKRMNNGGMGFVIISLVVCILSAFLLYGLFIPPQYAPGSKIGMGPTVSELFFWVYYMLGLPIVGALFLSHAFGFHHQDSEPGNHSLQKPTEEP
jgi:hypothetical protein